MSSPKSMFLGTFNINGSSGFLSADDGHKWLTANKAHEADIVILGFQECGTCRHYDDDDDDDDDEQQQDEEREGGQPFGIIPVVTPPLSLCSDDDDDDDKDDDEDVCSSSSSDNSDDEKKDEHHHHQDAADSPTAQLMEHEFYCRPHHQDEDGEDYCKQQDFKFRECITNALSKDHVFIADVAMGESPTPTEQQQNEKQHEEEEEEHSFIVMDFNDSDDYNQNNGENNNKQNNGTFQASENWYGFIRLMILAKIEYATLLSQSAQAILCPAGTKPSSHINHNKLPNYLPNRSPDKGAICIVIPTLNLLICNMHLCGTNSYTLSESHFDSIRIRQLFSITETCQSVLGTDIFQRLKPIVLGDLNFRCEVFGDSDASSSSTLSANKARGGKDFVAVHDIITLGNGQKIKELFWKHERLYRYLLRLQRKQEQHIRENTIEEEYHEEEEYPAILKNAVDLLSTECFHGDDEDDNAQTEWNDDSDDEKIILPTFTFPVSKKDLIIKRENAVQRQVQEKQANHDSSPCHYRRPYSDKRTPSWTDRILICQDLLLPKKQKEEDKLDTDCTFVAHEGCSHDDKSPSLFEKNNDENDKKLGHGQVVSIGAIHDIVISDHIPVYCMLKFS